MTNNKNHIWKLLLVGVSALLLNAASFASAEGTYTAKVRLPESISSGGLEYKLELKSRREARLEIKRVSRIRIDRDAIDTYGDQLTFLESPDKVNLTGSWSESRDGIRIDLDQIRSSEDSDKRDLSISLFADGQGYRVDSWDASFFGKTSQPRFVRASTRGGDDLLKGLAVIAAGALIVNSMSDKDSSGNDFRYETGGDGNASFGNGDRANLDRMRVDLQRGGNGTLILDGSYRVELKGTWRSTSSGYTLRVSDVRVSGTRKRASGNITLNRDRNRDQKRLQSISGSFRIEDDEWLSGTVSFRSARG